MNWKEAVRQSYPPALTVVIVLAFGALLVMDWVNLVRGDPDTRLATVVLATVAWLFITTSGVLTWLN